MDADYSSIIVDHESSLRSFSNIHIYIYKYTYIMLTTVAPEIVAFDIGEGPAKSGDTVTATCTVVKGDHPIQIEWALNGEPISRNHYDISIVNTSKRVSLLTIDGVTARHAGEYTCSVSNAAGGTSYSATLAVNGTPNPPRSRSLLFFRACTQPSSFPPSFLPSCILPRRRGEKGISNENEFVSLSRSRGMRRIKIGFNKIVLKQAFRCRCSCAAYRAVLDQ